MNSVQSCGVNQSLNAVYQITRQNSAKQKISCSLPSADTVCFKGHVSAEKFGKKGISILKKETGFFRDWETLQFVKKYIEENFKNKKDVRIVSGGCSTGEEAVTLSMVLNNIKDRVQILGIDLSKEAVEQANSRKFLFQDIKGLPKMFEVEDFAKALKDRFLVFNTERQLSETEKLQKHLFDEFFDITNEVVPKEKISLKQKFQNFVMRLVFPKFRPISYESKIVKLKDGMADNCSFKNGDITEINNLTDGHKSDVIFFKNAIYHMITEDVANGMLRRIKPEAEEIVEKIISKFRDNLNEGGLVCFGEEELLQTMDANDTIPTVMKKLGFKPLLKTAGDEVNVWQKCS